MKKMLWIVSPILLTAFGCYTMIFWNPQFTHGNPTRLNAWISLGILLYQLFFVFYSYRKNYCLDFVTFWGFLLVTSELLCAIDLLFDSGILTMLGGVGLAWLFAVSGLTYWTSFRYFTAAVCILLPVAWLIPWGIEYWKNRSN